jgi:hypothetical protein
MNRAITLPRSALAFFAFILLCFCATARGEEAAGVYFQHGDWEIACDNTVTCRIAGYCAAENDDEGCGSVLITRAAGPSAPLEGKVTLADIGDDENSTPQNTLTLRIDGKAKGKLKNPREGNFSLTSAQIHALLAAARKDGAVEFVGDAKSFTLSGKGISAVLLKADEVQGRIGTPGALIRKGDKPEESVFPPRPVPVIRAAKVISDAPSRPLTAPEIAALKPLLWQNKAVKEDCYDAYNEFTLTPLDDRHALIAMLCWRAAYNEGNAYWVVDSELAGTPEFVTTAADLYARGKIYGSFKGRGLGDCRAGSNWIWDGLAFRLSSEWTSGDCRGIHLGGAWHLPTYVTDIINADGTPRVPD